MTKVTMRRATPLLCGALATTLTGVAAIAATGDAATTTYAPREGFSRTLGSKTAIGFFENAEGRCAVTLMVAETFRGNQAEPASASRIRLSLSPTQTFDLSSVEVQGLTMRCGADGNSLAVGMPPVASM
jgi:hypothetical protein